MPDPGDPLLGRVLDGRYRVDVAVARGGMATVYEAHDLRLDRTVAVKVMHVGLGDDGAFAARFVREARAAARLSHPNVVAVHDQGDDGGTLFLAMELVRGHTLREVIGKEAPMGPARALALLEPVVSALAAAHRAGVVHRDVKPENVLIADDGRIKVADFGLAKAVGTDTQHTATGGILIGTVSYLAPELVAEGVSDARADVYAAGVLAYELLTGRKPHEGETPIQVAYKHVNSDVPAPSALVPGLPDFVDAFVARATARDRSQRPADAGVLLHHLHRVAHAVAEGSRSDPELTQDLAPLRLGTVPIALAGAAAPAPTEHRLDDSSPQVLEPEELDDFARGYPVDTGATHRAEATEETTVVPSVPAAAAAPVPAVRPAPEPPAEQHAPARGPRRRRRGLVLLVLGLVLAVGVAAGAWWFGWARYTTVPAVLGQTRAAAVAELEDAGFDVTVGDPVFSNTVEQGRVVSADPGAGQRLLPGASIEIIVSRGVEEYPVPDVVGSALQAARRAVAGTSLAVGDVVRRYSETVAEGDVISTDPRAGVVLRPGARVDLVVSKGRRPIPVGSWVGKDAEVATARLEKRGLVVDASTEVHDDTVPEGAVVSQSPTDGTLYRGETVSLTVSLGPEMVEVPGVRAQGVDAATETLEAAGFVVEVEQVSDYLGLGFVYRTDPSAGTMLPKGSTVTIFII
ncbi:PASTA domain-containing protein [Nocardioides bruguierae]|uniref:non-specific serine/threonine protein kinase n=1 Tax=Nocardioides bruguierae TaxID=2945102 RepID=A0A9X2D957_9ACTN|nr:Stk1 family PASTA domain-containing Ser/Thr kinase [Nocardioides bruguierae]MCM0621643.1 PASTA domain-containing protein [Nocardioides bruguierae]